MFNIKLPTDTFNLRTVILTKTKVEVDGTTKLIIKLRDVTDKVRLE